MTHVDPQQFQAADQTAQGQVGALCWRMNRGQVQTLLITSRDTGRWIIPKGWPMAGKTGAEAAGQEAWEEAGVEARKGTVNPLGQYAYDKILKPGLALPCLVTVYALRVSRLRGKFPEYKERRRKWFYASRAARKVAEAELRALLLAVAADPRLLTRPQTVAQTLPDPPAPTVPAATAPAPTVPALDKPAQAVPAIAPD